MMGRSHRDENGNEEWLGATQDGELSGCLGYAGGLKDGLLLSARSSSGTVITHKGWVMMLKERFDQQF
jgi:hypothetical protein